MRSLALRSAVVFGVVGATLTSGPIEALSPATTPTAPSTPTSPSPPAEPSTTSTAEAGADWPILEVDNPPAPGDVNPPTNAAPIQATSTQLPMPLPFPNPRAPEPEVRLGRISIPAIGVDESLYEGVSLTTLDRGPGHAPGTAMPGQIGNVVIGGHRVSHTHPFLDLHKLVPGDEMILEYNGQRFTYLVESTEIVLPIEARVVYPRWAYEATLFACHPLHSTRERIIVHFRMAT